MDYSEPPSIEQPVPAPAGEAGQPERRADGTLVFNVLTRQPCVPGTGKDGEIVVCAPDPEQYRVHDLETPAVQEFRPEVQLAPGVKVGAKAVAAGQTGAPAAVVNLTIKF